MELKLALLVLFYLFSLTLIGNIAFLDSLASSLNEESLPNDFIVGSLCSDRSDNRLQICLNTSLGQFPDLVGTDEADLIFGKFGFDKILGLEGNDILDGGENDDEIYGGDGNDNLYGALEDDFLFGGNDNDILVGYFGNDFLSGGNGSDELYGDSGNDILKGGPGPDFFDCGEHIDTVLDYNPAEHDILSQNCETSNNKKL